MMFSFDPLTYITNDHMCSYVFFQTIPPVLLLQILIHLGTTRMNRIIGVMGFLQYGLTETVNLRKSGLDCALFILHEVWTSTFCHQIFGLLNFGISDLTLAYLLL